MYVYFYTFTKRTNSTKIVDATSVERTCQLKEATDMSAPTLIIKDVSADWSEIWNYCWIPKFKRYYFVNNWRWLNGVWECDLVIDVLASFKIEIGNMSEYVARSSYTFDSDIVDTSYASTAQVSVQKTILTTGYYPAWNSGFYVIGIISKESNATQGAICYYQMTSTQFARLRAYLLSDTFLTDQGLTNLADFIPADATKVIYNPFQYIVSCKWFPFADTAIPNNYKTSVSSISFGWWNTGTGFSANRIHSDCPVYDASNYYAFHNHPQSARGNWLNRYPYSQRIVKFPPFGDIVLSDDIIYTNRNSELKTRLIVDFITGISYLELELVNNRNTVYEEHLVIARESQDLSVDIQLAQVGRDYYGAQATNIKNKIYEFNATWGSADLVTEDLGKALSSGAKMGVSLGQMEAYDTYVATDSYLKANAPQVITSGANGSISGFVQQAYLIEYFYYIENDDNDHIGRPLSQVQTLKNIPGFIMIKNADVAINCFENERALIKSFMSSGFFYE